ncbi:MAG: hypothetical protein WD025_00905 [Bacteriovoracaceae bacterium]
MKLLALVLSQLFVFSLPAGELFYGDSKPNHAAVSSNHVQTAQAFVQKRLKNETGHYDYVKVAAFQERILKEREYFLSDLYETGLIEEIELQISKESKALEEAKEVLDQKKGDFLIAFDHYLLPRLEALLKSVGNDPNCSERCDGIVDEFLTIYSSFYSPDRYRNYVDQDFNVWGHFLHRKGFFIPKRARELPEANNLVVGDRQQRQVQECLGVKKKPSSFLSESELRLLKECGLDLSSFNPGKSPFWDPAFDGRSYYEKHKDLFPAPGAPAYFKSVKMSGRGSPKIKAYFLEHGVEKKIKIKIGGLEPHAENIVGRAGALLGLHQDLQKYYSKIDVVFEDMDAYREFESFIFKKFGERGKNALYKIEDFGEGKKVVFRHVSVEASPDDLVKIGSPDVFGWDHKNRREYRSVLLWLGFLNIADVKNNNWRIQLRKTNKGLQPEVSLQDVGYSMGSSHIWDSFISGLTVKEKSRNVNKFSDSVVEDSGDSIRVKWSDVYSYGDLFETTTYNDLKWMARQILSIALDDWKWAIKAGGMSEIEERLYLLKIASRRDELAKVFKLEDEFSPFELGNFRDVNIDNKVKNGMVTAQMLEGSLYSYRQNSTMRSIGSFIQNSFDMELFNQKVQAVIGNELGGDFDIKFPFKLLEDKNFGFYLGQPGVEVGFSRKVEKTRHMQYENDVQYYYCVDSYTFSLKASAGIMTELNRHLPISVKGEVSLFKFTFDHYRPYSSAGKALKAPATLISSLSDMNGRLARLKRNEAFTYSSESDVKFEIKVGQGQDYRIKAGHERIKTDPVTFSRNQFGEFEVFQEKTSSRRNYVELNLGKQLSFFYVPLLGVEHSFEKFESMSKLYHFPLPERTMDDAIGQDYAATDLKILRELVNGNFNNPLIETKRKYSLETQGSTWTRRSFLKLLFSGQKSEMYAKTSIIYKGDYKDGKQKTFHRFLARKSAQTGVSHPNLAHLLVKKNESEVEIQLENDDPKDFVVILNNFNYKRNRTKYGLEVFIDELNELYSGKEPFFTKDALPPADEVDHYKKVLSHVRVFLFGKGLLQKLDKLWDHELRAIVREGVMERSSLVGEANAYKLYKKLQWIRTLFRMESLDKKTVVKQLGKTIYGLKAHKNGLTALKKLFGENHMFVMGEIYGVLPSFSYSQDQNTLAERRFAGKSWGKYRDRPPFWKFLKDFPIMARPAYAPHPMDIERFMPNLPTGEPDGIPH